MPTPAKTPTESKPGNMTFPEAMSAVLAGAKVTKLEWGNDKIYLFLDGTLNIMKEDGTVNTLIVSDGDMLGTDWVVVDHSI